MTDFEKYNVVLLVEQALTTRDAEQVRSLHSGLEQPVAYFVLQPIEDAAARVEAALGSLSAGEFAAAPMLVMNDVDLDEVRKDAADRSNEALEQTLANLRATGAEATGAVSSKPPIDALTEAVAERDAQEAIILTRPHVVAEFFHVDWTSRARRKLGVPVLHLLEHENFDEQAGSPGEGISGF
jgi:hypothetical protein